MLAESDRARSREGPDPDAMRAPFTRMDERLRNALWLADNRPRGRERVRQWWTQADVLEGIAAVHGADEELTAASTRPDLLARVPLVRADLTRLLDQDDPRRRDVLRLLDRLDDENCGQRGELGPEEEAGADEAGDAAFDVEGEESIDRGMPREEEAEVEGPRSRPRPPQE